MTVEAAVSAWWERLCLSFQDLFRRFGFLNILIGIEEVTGSFSPLESDLGKSMALPHSLEKLPEDFLVEVEVLGVLILTLWKTQGQKAPQHDALRGFVSVKPNDHGGLVEVGDDFGSGVGSGGKKRVCGGGEDDDMVLMIVSAGAVGMKVEIVAVGSGGSRAGSIAGYWGGGAGKFIERETGSVGTVVIARTCNGIKSNNLRNEIRGGDDVGSVWQRGKRVCGGGEDDDMVLMIDSAVMWMMVESGVARLEWPEVSPDNGRRRREML
ncbi:hypothetical protein Tco_0347990 [Tanacetum coccineum]